MKHLIFAVVTVVCLPMLGQQQAVSLPTEPTNLDGIKQQLREYRSCKRPDCYMPQIERQIGVAQGFLKDSLAHAGPNEKLALVLDIDETALSNWRVETHDDFAFIPADFNWCVSLQCGEAIAATLDLFREAQRNGVSVFFITGRPETQRKDTEADLRAVGYDGWTALFLQPICHPATQSVAEFKSSERDEIKKMGYRIILNVGDQLSDLTGKPQADHSVKLPNPFYFIP